MGFKKSLKGHSDTIRSVKFSPDGTLIVTGSQDKLAMIWDGKTRVKLQNIRKGIQLVSIV